MAPEPDKSSDTPSTGRDYREAARWYERAAEQGDMAGQEKLADFLARGAQHDRTDTGTGWRLDSSLNVAAQPALQLIRHQGRMK